LKYKMVIVMRNDLNMRKGKMVAQGAHAAMMPLVLNAGVREVEDKLYNWLTQSAMLKVCVRCDSEAQLLDIEAQANAAGIECHVITDAGFTEFNGVPTKTCLALGPDLNERIDSITGSLKLL